jgi:peptide/nickel transport system permease protein
VGGGFLLWRLAHAVVVVFGVLTVVFFLVRVTPGDPVLLMVSPDAPATAVAELREKLGFDRPLPVQYVRYLRRALTGDLGASIRHYRPVVALILERLPATAELTATSMALALLVAVPLGILAAVRRGSPSDLVSRAVALVGQSMPTFWLGILLIILFSVQLRLLPTSGRGTFAQLVLPTVTLGFFMIGLVARVTRAAMLEVLRTDYVRTARAKGLAERRVVSRHALRNAAIPVVTVIGLQVGTLLGGAIITEAVFAWPGIGSLAVTAIYQRDYPLVQGVVLLAGLVFVVVNLLADVSYVYLDPRIRYEQ